MSPDATLFWAMKSNFKQNTIQNFTKRSPDKIWWIFLCFYYLVPYTIFN